jgi:hypothetical protein
MSRPAVRITCATAALLALTGTPTAQASPAHQAAPTSDPPTSVTTDERGCTEIAYTRGGLRDQIRALVPDRYDLVTYPPPSAPAPPPDAPARVQLNINEVVCDVVTTRDGGSRSRDRKVTTVIVSADTSTIDGQPSDGVYTLLFATDNRLQASAMKRLGWPVERLARRSGGGTTTYLGGFAQAHVSPRGASWDHDVIAQGLTPFPELSSSTAVFHRDTATAQLKLCFVNLATVVNATYAGDLTRTPLATVTAVPPVFRGYEGYLVRGGWRSTLTADQCPAGDDAPTGRRDRIR